MSYAGNVLEHFASHDWDWGFMREKFLENGYKFFNKSFDMNIFGVRNSNRVAGEFDDLVGIAYRDHHFCEEIHFYQATTDPSDQYLLKPLNPNGTIAIVPGQYRGVYKVGIHGRTWASGGYEALEQVGELTYIRDNNKDNILDFDNPQFRGIHKTNIHRASKWNILDKVGPYSAGCQVIQDPADFASFMDLCKLQVRELGANSFSYTLFDLDDLLS